MLKLNNIGQCVTYNSDLGNMDVQKDIEIIIENDLILTSGEAVSVGLLSAILKKRNIKSIPLLGWQIPIITDSNHQKAKILNINKVRIDQYLNDYDVIVVAGFQGVDSDGKITSLGRGGSDTTAVAIAAAVNADRCDIYTDVDGIYTTDPRITASAKKLDKISYEEMLELASLGAKVLQTRSVELAMQYKVKVRVLNSFKEGSGTLLCDEEIIMEKKVVSGITFSKNEAKLTLLGVKDKPGVAGIVFDCLSRANINVDMIVQNISNDRKTTDLTYTVPKEEFDKAKNLMEDLSKNLSYESLIVDSNITKISLVGVGMRSNAGVASQMFRVLSENNINIDVISTSEIKISVIIDKRNTKKALTALHKEFKLD